MRRALATLTTRRLDGRSAIAVAVRRWNEDVRRDLGGHLTRAQETLLELAAQSWVIVEPGRLDRAAAELGHEEAAGAGRGAAAAPAGRGARPQSRSARG